MIMATFAIATPHRWVDGSAKPKYSSGDPLRSPCKTCINGFSSMIHRPWPERAPGHLPFQIGIDPNTLMLIAIPDGPPGHLADFSKDYCELKLVGFKPGRAPQAI